MRALLVLAAVLLASCATLDGPPPLTGADIVQRVRDGRNSSEIIAELQKTNTVLPLQASDMVALHNAGVPDEVLNYLQRAQIDDIRWRDRYMYGGLYGGYYGGFYRGWGPCPFPARRGSMWAC